MKEEEKNQALENEVFELCEKNLNDELSVAELERLEILVVDHAWVRKIYVEYMHQHAGLYWQHTSENDVFSLASLVSESTIGESRVEWSGKDDLPVAEEHHPEDKVVSGPWAWRKMAAVAAVLVGGVVLGWGVSGQVSSPPVVATLIKASNCSWRSGALPTEEGAELIAGRL